MTGNRFALDTNAVIALQRENNNLLGILNTGTDVFIPTIVLGELYFGAYGSQQVNQNLQSVTAVLQGRSILQVDKHTAVLYGQIKQQLRIKGRPIPENDIWIGALCIQYHLVLLTLDKHFLEIDSLVIRSW